MYPFEINEILIDKGTEPYLNFAFGFRSLRVVVVGCFLFVLCSCFATLPFV